MKSASAMLLAFVAGVDRGVLAVEQDSFFPKMSAVPQVLNPDKNGFPTIKSVQAVMQGFQKEKDILNHDAAALGVRLKQLEKEGADRIAQQNIVYLGKMKEQEKKNQAVSLGNAKLAQMIMKVRKGNDKLSALVHQQQQLVDLRRSQFTALKNKIMEGEKRVDQLLEVDPSASSDTFAPMSFLQRRQEGARRKKKQPSELAEPSLPSDFSELPAPDLEAYSGVDEQAQTQVEVEASAMPDATSLSEKSSANIFSGSEMAELEKATGFQISSLSKQANKLNQETAHSLALLKASFQESYKAGARRYNALMQQEEVLKENLKSTEEEFSKLKAKYKKVTGVRKGLDQELKKNGVSPDDSQKMETAALSDEGLA